MTAYGAVLAWCFLTRTCGGNINFRFDFLHETHENNILILKLLQSTAVAQDTPGHMKYEPGNKNSSLAQNKKHRYEYSTSECFLRSGVAY